MYRVLVETKRKGGRFIEGYYLQDEFKHPMDADKFLKERADNQKLIKKGDVVLVQHHAGQSVVFYKSGNYTEYTRMFNQPKI